MKEKIALTKSKKLTREDLKEINSKLDNLNDIDCFLYGWHVALSDFWILYASDAVQLKNVRFNTAINLPPDLAKEFYQLLIQRKERLIDELDRLGFDYLED